MSRHKVVVRAFLTSDRRHPTSQSRTADSTRVFNTTCRSKVAPCLCRYLGTTGKRLWHDPAMRLPSACDSRKVTARQRDSRDRITGLRLAATTVRAMARGTVKWFNPTKGYGFIQPQGSGGKDVFVHISAVERAGLSSLNEGQTVEYEIESNRGKESAINLKVK